MENPVSYFAFLSHDDDWLEALRHSEQTKETIVHIDNLGMDEFDELEMKDLNTNVQLVEQGKIRQLRIDLLINLTSEVLNQEQQTLPPFLTK